MKSRKRGHIVKQAAEQKSLGLLISLIVVLEIDLSAGHSQHSSTIGPHDDGTVRGFGRRPVVFLNELGKSRHLNGFVHDVAVKV